MSQAASRELSIMNGSLTLKDSQFSSLDAQLLQENSCRIQNLEIREKELTSIEQTGIFSLSNLQCLDLRNNKLDYISDQISLLKNLSVLRLDHNNISSIPNEIFDLPLVVLTLGFNSLFSVPKSIQNLKGLTFLSFAENHIQDLPIELGNLKSLKTLHLHKNDFWRIPCKIGQIETLQEITLEWMHYISPVCTKFLKGTEKQGKLWELKGLLIYKFSKGFDFLALDEFLYVFSDNDFDLNKTDLRNRNLVHLAAINGDLGVLSGLIKAGCDLNLQDIDECSPLVSALRENNIQGSKLLLEAGANPNSGGGLFGCPLNLAVVKSELWIVKEILKSKQFSFSSDNNGNSCLHHLMSIFKKHKHKNSLIADMLVNSGLPVNQVNNDNWTALHIAARKGQTSAIRWAGRKNHQLKQSGKELFDFNCLGGKNSWSPLHLAAQSGNFKTVVALIQAGALAFVKNSDGKTPKNIAKGDIVMFKYLKRMELEHIKLLVQNEDVLNGEEKMPTGIELEYKRLYSHFTNGNLHGIENSVKYSQFASVKADAFYLWNQVKEKNNLRIFMKISEKDGLLVRKEMINAFQIVPKAEARLSLRDGRIGPRLSKSNPPRQSLPSHLLKEDDTHSESVIIA
jgi:ankyrin repeat protein